MQHGCLGRNAYVEVRSEFYKEPLPLEAELAYFRPVKGIDLGVTLHKNTQHIIRKSLGALGFCTQYGKFLALGSFFPLCYWYSIKGFEDH